jgi:predicted nuclease of predicted toxin-antitoxin system
MRLLLDQGLPRSAARFLREAAIDTVHVGELGLSTADDATILQRGRDEGRTVVTLDADFHALLAISRATALQLFAFAWKGCMGQRRQN